MIPINILTQPDDETCGPTSLHAVYQYYGDSISLEQTIAEVTYLEEGGTLAVLLGCHALARGYKAKIYTYNLSVFDPTWFDDNQQDLIEKLQTQKKIKNNNFKLHKASDGYIEFLSSGGKLLFADLTSSLLTRYFKQQIPILAGLSATHLYRCKREYAGADKTTIYDDLRGYPTGHFVVLWGYDEAKKHVMVADPYRGNPFSGSNYYSVKVSHLINSIMLGILTYDANILIIEKNR